MREQSFDDPTRSRRFATLVIVLLAALVSAAVAYNFGLTRGLAQAGVAAGTALPPPPYYGYYGPRPWGFGLFGPFALLLFWLVAIRALGWGPFGRRGWYGRGYHGVERRLDEWHREAHERMNQPSAAPNPPEGSR